MNPNLCIYSRKKKSEVKIKPHTLFKQNQESYTTSKSPCNTTVEYPPLFISNNDLGVPIALRKSIKSCTQHFIA